jgi:alkylation response protein AidB-like acyl-CoA dehydrogenase
VSPVSVDLADVLEVVGEVASSVAESSASVGDARGSLDRAGLHTHRQDTAGEPEALTWHAHTVRLAAESSCSPAYMPAGRCATRAPVADMALKVDAVQALFDGALTAGARTERVAASARRTAVEGWIDAIQTHGGYGCFDKYPLAGLIRDAISLQACAGGRRLHVARVADAEPGPTGGGV